MELIMVAMEVGQMEVLEPQEMLLEVEAVVSQDSLLAILSEKEFQL